MAYPLEERYLELLKKSLLDELYIENEALVSLLFQHLASGERRSLESLMRECVDIRHSKYYKAIAELRNHGAFIRMFSGPGQEFTAARCIHVIAHTMIGRLRMNNLQDCMNQVVADKVPGDFLEAGVWRGGATIFMRGFLQAHGITRRKVWVADSFQGLPAPTLKQDEGWDFSAAAHPYLAVSDDYVRELFQRYDLLDAQVQFLKGWFKDTLPKAPIKKLALLRLDGDLYESTRDALTSLGHKVSPGGFVIVDDYYAFPQCRLAVDEYRKNNFITDPLTQIDQDSVFWRFTGRS